MPCACARSIRATQNLQPCGIDDQVDRAVVGSGQGRHRNDLVPARECGVVRGLEVEAHQAEQRVQEPLGLAERQAEDDPQRQRGPDREVRVPPLASAKTVLRWYPRGNCILAQPDRDVAAAPEATLVLPPVPDSVLRLVLAVDSARLRCDHDVTPPISMMDWTPPPPLACSLTPIHAPTPRNGDSWRRILKEKQAGDRKRRPAQCPGGRSDAGVYPRVCGGTASSPRPQSPGCLGNMGE